MHTLIRLNSFFDKHTGYFLATFKSFYKLLQVVRSADTKLKGSEMNIIKVYAGHREQAALIYQEVSLKITHARSNKSTFRAHNYIGHVAKACVAANYAAHARGEDSFDYEIEYVALSADDPLIEYYANHFFESEEDDQYWRFYRALHDSSVDAASEFEDKLREAILRELLPEILGTGYMHEFDEKCRYWRGELY